MKNVWLRSIAIVTLTALPAAAAEVRLRSSVATTTSIVRLADVAEVQGDDARLTQALAETPLFPAPAAGQQRVLTQQDLRQLLAASGIANTAAMVTGSESVTILGEAGGQARSGPRRLLVAGGIRQAVFEATTDKLTKPSPAPASFSRPSPASQAPETKEPKPLPLVERGSAVTVHARTAGVRVTSAGKALEAGGLGDTISIELPEGKQRVLARITGSQVVEIGASTNRASPASHVLGSANQ